MHFTFCTLLFYISDYDSFSVFTLSVSYSLCSLISHHSPHVCRSEIMFVAIKSYYDVTLKNIKKYIDSMTKTQHIEILRIMEKNPIIKLYENRNGVYITTKFTEFKIKCHLLRWFLLIKLNIIF